MRLPRRIFLVLALILAPVAVSAQDRLGFQSPILTIEFERFFAQSAYGRAAQGLLEAEAAELNTENRRIEAELVAEERALTEERKSLSAEEFRPKAEAFDVRVQTIRAERLEKARALEARQTEIRRAFEQAAAPIIQELMSEAGAAVIVEQSTVLFSLTVVDITEAAIARVDAAGLLPNDETAEQ